MLTPEQLRAARTMVDWTRKQLAAKSKTAVNTIKAYERMGSDPKLSTLGAWRRALEHEGVEFLEPVDDHGPGLRFKKRKR